MLKRRGGRGRRSQECQYGLGEGGGDKTGSSTAGGGPVCGTSPSPASSVRSSTGAWGRGGIKLVAQLSAVVPSVVPHPAQPAALGAVRGGGDKTGSSTAGGGPVWYLTQPSQQR